MHRIFPLLLSLATQLCHTDAVPLAKRVSSGIPSIPQDFADPSVIKANNSWFAFATTNGKYNVQIAESADFKSWNVLAQDALPILPTWAQAPIWAPDISQLDDESFVMYYSASVVQYPAHHCIGAAISSNVTGPYSPTQQPFVCPDPIGKGSDVGALVKSPGKGGAIDSSGFKDVDGKRYVVYKVDGNSVGSGGTCGNSNPNPTPTPIMLVQVDTDGITALGTPVQLLDRTDADGPLVEAPSIVRSPNGIYNLFFSSNCYVTPNYDVTWATAPAITGPYTRTGPLITSGQDGFTAPGGATIAADGTHMVFHANFGSGRAMFTSSIRGNGAAIRLS